MTKQKRRTCDIYQTEVAELLRKIFPELEVKKEWSAFKRTLGVYSPRVDITVGPYSTAHGESKVAEYNRLVEDETSKRFLRNIYELHLQNIQPELSEEINPPNFEELIYRNYNARCFMAIEIENTSTKKHIMGSIVNAASLGRIGIGIAYNDSVFRTFIRITAYLSFLKRVGKNTYDTTNFIIVTKEQFLTLLNNYQPIDKL